jgi:alpha-galactosidase
MKSRVSKVMAAGAILLFSLSSTMAATKPLKVFILVGQSNMEGHAMITTFPVIAKDPKTADLYKDMVDASGKPVVCENVYIAYTFGDFNGNSVGKKSGKLTAGWGSQHHVGAGKIGPEFTFGITMNKLLNEPILLIKTAWGGKSLQVDFRPPSGGDLPADSKNKDAAGKYYKLMMDYVKEVLADPKAVYPSYDPAAGYELAGFVWFQGFNDLVGNYPATDPSKGKKAIKDYSEYSRLLACLIRDVRKDLSAPKLPFVIGVLGVGGETTGDGTEAFRKAMAAPGEMEEFKGTVENVFTHKYWPSDIDAVKMKLAAATSELDKKGNILKMRSKKGEDVKEAMVKLAAEKKSITEQALTAEEKFLLENGCSNQGFHYYGSGKFFGQIGKAFAEALVNVKK